MIRFIGSSTFNLWRKKIPHREITVYQKPWWNNRWYSKVDAFNDFNHFWRLDCTLIFSCGNQHEGSLTIPLYKFSQDHPESWIFTYSIFSLDKAYFRYSSGLGTEIVLRWTLSMNFVFNTFKKRWPFFTIFNMSCLSLLGVSVIVPPVILQSRKRDFPPPLHK